MLHSKTQHSGSPQDLKVSGKEKERQGRKKVLGITNLILQPSTGPVVLPTATALSASFSGTPGISLMIS